jgi:hypothetical protein|tara:strand:- start:567 stop:1166 length:600 start_codon:yes stop_codon:yes gene_type:complete
MKNLFRTVGIVCDYHKYFSLWKSLTSTVPEILKIDHIAIAASSHNKIIQLEKILADGGGKIILPVHIWPKSANLAKEIPKEDHKYMCSIAFDHFFVVAVSPNGSDDTISKFAGNSKEPKIHHLAVLVSNLKKAINSISEKHDFLMLGSFPIDNAELKQVFMRRKRDDKIIEIVWRKNPESTSLDDKNISFLSASLRNSS